MELAGFQSVAHTPCIFNAAWEYQTEASLYLRHRALPDASNIDASKLQFGALRYPTRDSLKTFAYWFANFLEWCDATNVRWQDLEYTIDIVKGYQTQMLSGAWSERRQRLSSSTVNSRVGEACKFLQWAARLEFRKPFNVAVSRRTVRADSGKSAIGHKLKAVDQRAGAVRPDPKKLRLPSSDEVAVWLQSVQVRHGQSKSLACELIIQTGVRREEVVQWRVNTLPLDRDSWDVNGDYVTVEVKYGAKGGKTRDNTGALVGPSRFIVIPLEFAERLAEYRAIQRPKLLAMYARAAASPQERRARMNKPSNRLFLSDFNGQPISAASVYDAWTIGTRIPFAGWSPHTGRHYWACTWLLNAMRKRYRLLKLAKESSFHTDAISATARDVLLFEVQPQLGHISEETTQRYIKWLLSPLVLKYVSDAYSTSLETSAKSCDGS